MLFQQVVPPERTSWRMIHAITLVLITNPDEGSATPAGAPFLSLISTKPTRSCGNSRSPTRQASSSLLVAQDRIVLCLNPSVDGNQNHSA